jgi:hypothetical protein
MLEDVKKIAGRIAGWSRPSIHDLSDLVRERKASTFRFKDDGIIPNHPKWPFPKKLDPAAVFEELFESNGWGSGTFGWAMVFSGMRRGLFLCWQGICPCRPVTNRHYVLELRAIPAPTCAIKPH